jgi:hypothetical protein
MQFLKSSSLKLLGQLELNFTYIIRGWLPFTIVSGNPDIHPTWPLLQTCKTLHPTYCARNRYFLSNSVHLVLRTGLPDKIFKRDHQRIMSAKLESNWPSSFNERTWWRLSCALNWIFMCYSTGTIYFSINPEELYDPYEENSVKNLLLQIKFWKRHVSNKTLLLIYTNLVRILTSKGGEAYQASYVRKVWRHQRGNENQYIEEEQR